MKIEFETEFYTSEELTTFLDGLLTTATKMCNSYECGTCKQQRLCLDLRRAVYVLKRQQLSLEYKTKQ